MRRQQGTGGALSTRRLTLPRKGCSGQHDPFFSHIRLHCCGEVCCHREDIILHHTFTVQSEVCLAGGPLWDFCVKAKSNCCASLQFGTGSQLTSLLLYPYVTGNGSPRQIFEAVLGNPHIEGNATREKA